jgi:hypothetical protein
VYPHVPAIDPEEHAAIELAVNLGGHNSWRGSHERDHARRVLGPAIRDGLIDVDTLAGYVLGYAKVTKDDPKNLRALLEPMTR